MVELEKDETPAQCMERIEATVARDLEIRTTKFTAKDKVRMAVTIFMLSLDNAVI